MPTAPINNTIAALPLNASQSAGIDGFVGDTMLADDSDTGHVRIFTTKTDPSIANLGGFSRTNGATPTLG